ncbi:MAG: hypothetical protein Q7K26_06700 [bacterium]|nr:hypothetical protein [bacterium]
MKFITLLLLLGPFSLLFGWCAKSFSSADIVSATVAGAGALGWLAAAWLFAKRQP